MFDIVLHIYSNLGEFLSFSTSSFIKQLLLHECKRLHKKNQQLLQKNNGEQPLQGSWQEIPLDIMEIIVQRLSLSDRIRLSIVCKSWRSHVNIWGGPQFPWLTLPHNPNKKQIVSFYDLYEGEVYNMKLPKALQGAVCWGSSKGWLVMTKERPCLLYDMICTATENIKMSMPYFFDDIISLVKEPVPDTEIFLFNPISRALHQLPSLSTIPDYYRVVWSFKEGYRTSFIIQNIELSSADTSECIVAASLIGCDNPVLAFCKPGDKQWSIFHDKEGYDRYDISDILFYKGTLYVLIDSNNEPVENHTFGLVDCEVSIKFLPNLNYDEGDDGTRSIESHNDNFGTVIEEMCDAYLIESTNGELLSICRSLDSLVTFYNDDEGNLGFVNLMYRKTKAFKVFKMDPNTGHLSRLQSLGDQVLFVAHGGSLSCWAKDFVGVQGNCIYFANDVVYGPYGDNYNPLLSRESGVYYIEDGKIERNFPSVNFPLQSQMSWFTPLEDAHSLTD